ncbi:MAG: 30S ribosomal protein S4 [Deltaproteobacteria bacterium]|nr:30S ribosomal protein S4 [Deltaproteobacteria bacterium]
MARYTGSVCRLCRREGMKLFLKAERCYTDRCAIERRAYPPGQHGQGRTKFSEYGTQLREKQKVRRMYGVLEKQFEEYFNHADRMKGITGENLLMLLERRLDNAVYRSGFSGSRSEGRQFVRHGHVLINGRKCTIPSRMLKVGDVISVREKSRKIGRLAASLEAVERRGVPSWLELEKDQARATVKSLPGREELTLPIQEQLIVELYSR